MVVGFGLLGGRLSLLRALIAVLVTSELFVQVRRFGVEFHRRDDAHGARQTLRDLLVTSSATTGADLIRARELVTEANPAAVNLVVGPGERVVVTGASGVGKTTLLHTLLGWRPAVAGSATRTSAPIGYVGADTALLSGTLRDNLTLGATLRDEDLLARLASLGLTGERFDDLETPLLSDGRGLSTGEGVRVLLARALLAEARLLVLDDLAGVLDEDARVDVRRALEGLVDVAIIEATIDTPLLLVASQRLELRG
jgi:ABC-type transport system involved in cytochrome bd biosynthesis fused ATPase/permease subunit